MVKYEYIIVAIGSHGGETSLRRGIENKEEAQLALAQIIKHISARRTRFVFLGDVVIEPTNIMAYRICERRVWEEDDSVSAAGDSQGDEAEVDFESVTVIDMDGAKTVEDTPREGVEETPF